MSETRFWNQICKNLVEILFPSGAGQKEVKSTKISEVPRLVPFAGFQSRPFLDRKRSVQASEGHIGPVAVEPLSK